MPTVFRDEVFLSRSAMDKAAGRDLTKRFQSATRSLTSAASLQVVLLAAMPLILADTACAQNTNTPPITNAVSENELLIRDRRSNEQAQAAYYRARTVKLQEPPSGKSFWEYVPALLGVVGALGAAIWGIFVFSFHYRATLQNQLDTQFNEALKRLWEKDNFAIRASAVGLLKQMSERKLRTLKWGRKNKVQLVWDWPYFETTLEQFMVAMQLEENSKVFGSIVDGVAELGRRKKINWPSSKD